LLHQILIDTLGTQAHLDLSGNHLGQRFAVTPAASPNAGDRNGWFCSLALLKPGRTIAERRRAGLLS
jgi:hypothetical protein